MKIKFIRFSIIAMTMLMGATSATAQPFGRPQVVDPTGYKDTYQGYFPIGVAVNMRNITDPAQIALIKKNFNSITAENDMKPVSLQPKEGQWNWENADKIANFCRANGIKLRGHCLCWHNQFCDWMFVDKKGKEVSKEVFYARLRKHIHTVVNRYKDVVYAWDVVNEAIADGDGRRMPWQKTEPSPYRQSRAFKLGGDEFICYIEENDFDEVDALADAIHENVTRLGEEARLGLPITVSIGCALLEKEDYDAAYKKADGALYRAKNGGRNQHMIVG